MSYYYSLTPDQVEERKNAFDNAFHYEDGGYIIKTGIYSITAKNLIADYIGYLIYRSNCKQRKYREKEIDAIKYLTHFRQTDQALAGWIRTFGLEDVQTINPLAYRMFDRFMKLGDGI